jgi:heme-degrading monooxygenase HmoA
MITRLVKMTFRPSETENFKAIFEANKSAIANFPGCLHVELKRDVNSPEVFFTISKWDSLEDLERYRNSELFKGVWGKTKVLFGGKAEAWSLGDFVS